MLNLIARVKVNTKDLLLDSVGTTKCASVRNATYARVHRKKKSADFGRWRAEQQHLVELWIVLQDYLGEIRGVKRNHPLKRETNKCPDGGIRQTQGT